MADEIVGQYNDGNRAFVQAFMARGSMTLKDSKPILAAIFTAEGTATEPEDVTQQDLDSYLRAATQALSAYDYEIRSAAHQVSGHRIYSFVNSTSDPLTQIATTRSPEELNYIKRLLDAMFETYNTPSKEIMGVTSIQALKVVKPSRQDRDDEEGTQAAVDKGLTNTQAERLLASLIAEGWLERSKDGWHTLSTRALLELRTFLITTYNEENADDGDWQRIKKCLACKEIVTVGQRCRNNECNARLHDICQSNYWKTQRDRVCPICKTKWDGRAWVGEKVITTSEAWLTGRRRSGKQQEVVQEAAVNESDESD